MALQTFTAGQVLTAAQVTALQTNGFNQSVSTKTADHTLVAADKGTRVEMNSASATTITVDTGLFNAGDTLFIQNIGAGVCTITAGTATVSTAGSLALAQNAGGTLYFTSAGVSIFFPTVGSVASASGLTLINTTTFSAVASQSVNNVFSATYENYRILTNITSQSVDGSYFLKMRVGGVDSSVSYFLINGGFTSTNSGYNTNANNQTTGFNLGDIDAGVNDLYGFNGDIMNPFLSVPTRLLGLNNGATTSGTPALQFGGGVHNVATSHTSFTLVAGAGNITGNVKVYGYAK